MKRGPSSKNIIPTKTASVPVIRPPVSVMPLAGQAHLRGISSLLPFKARNGVWGESMPWASRGFHLLLTTQLPWAWVFAANAEDSHAFLATPVLLREPAEIPTACCCSGQFVAPRDHKPPEDGFLGNFLPVSCCWALSAEWLIQNLGLLG